MRLRVLLAVGLALAAVAPGRARAELVRADTDARSVYSTSWWVDVPVIVGANAVTLGMYLGVEPTPFCPCDPNSVGRFDRRAIGNHSDAAYEVANFTVAASLVMPLALDAGVLRDPRILGEDTIVLAEALSISGALVSIAKASYARPFPRTYDGRTFLDQPGSYRSFYSGHTTLTFTALSTAAMTIGRRYHVHVVPWVVTVLVGSSVAAELVLSGWHFPSDVIVGAVIGTAVGVTVPALHFEEAPVRPVVMTSRDGSPVVGLAGTWR